MLVAHHHDVDIIFSVGLLLRNDDLAGLDFIGVRDWLVENTDAPDNISELLNLLLR